MGENKNDATAAYAVLNANGSVVAFDATFNRWLAAREISQLLPELKLSGGEPGARQMELHPQDLAPTVARVELVCLEGHPHASMLLCVQVLASSTGDETYRDVVTGLPDRSALAAHRSKWHREIGRPLSHALLFMDLDNFKSINDQFGHATGDKVLAVLAERWRKLLRGNDLIVRYGGDEFVVLLAGICSQAVAQPIIDRLKQATAASIHIDDRLIHLTAAIGVAMADDISTPLDELLASADKAMYASKREYQ
jgi:diguanylate cyclase (GGDEF)-like protein